MYRTITMAAFIHLFILSFSTNAAVIDFDDYNTEGTNYITLVNTDQTTKLGQGMQITSLNMRGVA